jgi:hypothetical protein
MSFSGSRVASRVFEAAIVAHRESAYCSRPRAESRHMDGRHPYVGTTHTPAANHSRKCVGCILTSNDVAEHQYCATDHGSRQSK